MAAEPAFTLAFKVRVPVAAIVRGKVPPVPGTRSAFTVMFPTRLTPVPDSNVRALFSPLGPVKLEAMVILPASVPDAPLVTSALPESNAVRISLAFRKAPEAVGVKMVVPSTETLDTSMVAWPAPTVRLKAGTTRSSRPSTTGLLE